MNEDFDDEDNSDDEEGQAPEHTQCFLALNSISDDKTKVVMLDEMLQNKECEKAFLESDIGDEQGVDNTVQPRVLVQGAEERKDEPENIDHSDDRIIVPFARDKVPVNLGEEFLFAKAFPQQVSKLSIVNPFAISWLVALAGCFIKYFFFPSFFPILVVLTSLLPCTMHVSLLHYNITVSLWLW